MSSVPDPLVQIGGKYEYKPIPEENSIRCLVLEPGDTDERLSCSMVVTNLDNPIHYEAISYTWGNSHLIRPITIESQTSFITANLDSALRRVRFRDKRRILWADSICINQEDGVEKGAQVLLMGKVYKNSKQVLIYIGSGDAERGEAVRSLVCEIDTMVLEELGRLGNSWNTFPAPSSEKREQFLSDERWDVLFSMTRQPWFTRGWVIQEASFAADALLLWGTTEISWHSFVRSYTWMIRKLPQARVRYRVGEFNRLHLELYRIHHKQETMPLYTPQTSKFDFIIILHDARALCVQDPRDRVYAFLSLATSAGLSLNLRPDYSNTKTAEEVYLDLAREYIMSSGDINLLHCVQHTDDTLKAASPSWVPRWNLNMVDNVITHTSAPPLVSSTTSPIVSIDNTLKLTGYIFDEVIFSSRPLTRDVSMQEIKVIWDQISNFATELDHTHTPMAIEFSRVLSVGRSWGVVGPEWVKWRTAYIETCLENIQTISGIDHPCSEGIEGFHQYAQWNVHNRRIIFTKLGFYGLAPLSTQLSDLCCILSGAKTPFILRQNPVSGQRKLIGDTFMSGKMLLKYPEPDGKLLSLESRDEFDHCRLEFGVEDICLH